MTAVAFTEDPSGEFPTLTLENEHLRAELLPTLGAKVLRLVHKESGRDVLWQNPRVPPCPVLLGADYDDNFSGGWDELFPNDAAGGFSGADWPDHGELWCQPWTWQLVSRSDSGVSVRLQRRTACVTAVVEKVVTLRAGESRLRFAHVIRNTGSAPIDFLWKLHPALRLGPASRLDVPAERAVVVHPGWSRCQPALHEFPWPIARLPDGTEIDFQHVPPPGSGTRDFLYLLGLRAGWCALTDTDTGVGLGLAFPRSVFPSVWLFLTNGGWRGLDCLVLEPCTTWPKDLQEALARGQIAHLDPGAELQASVVATVFRHHAGVAGISPDGDVIGR